MIPYYAPPSLQLGPLTIEPFGIFVAAGIFLAARIIMKEAVRDGLDPTPFQQYALWGVGIGMLAAHWFHLFLYHPEELSKSPFQIIKFWDGMSSTGGLIGGLVAAVVFFRKRKVKLSAYLDAFAVGLPLGWAVARIGCFAVHDHPGVHTDFFLAVRFPDGPRHDLGLYDAIALTAIGGLTYWLHRRRLLRAKLIGLLSLLYGIARFFFDSLRATDLQYVDKRYLGLTPAQYVCIGFVLFGVAWLARRVDPKPELPSAG